MTRLQLRLSPLFCMFALALALCGRAVLLAAYMFALLLHESAHAYAASRRGYRLDTVSLMPYGAQLDGDLGGILLAEEIAVALADLPYRLG